MGLSRRLFLDPTDPARPAPARVCGANCRRAPPLTLICRRVWASTGVPPKPAATAAATRLRLISIHFPAATRPRAKPEPAVARGARWLLAPHAPVESRRGERN